MEGKCRLKHMEHNGNKRSNPLREKIRQIVEHKYFQPFIISIILLNGVIIVAESYLTGNDLPLTLDTIIVWIFVVELALKMIGLGVRGYFSEKWNIFDFLIVVASLLFYNTPLVSVLRLIRCRDLSG